MPGMCTCQAGHAGLALRHAKPYRRDTQITPNAFIGKECLGKARMTAALCSADSKGPASPLSGECSYSLAPGGNHGIPRALMARPVRRQLKCSESLFSLSSTPSNKTSSQQEVGAAASLLLHKHMSQQIDGLRLYIFQLQTSKYLHEIPSWGGRGDVGQKRDADKATV